MSEQLRWLVYDIETGECVNVVLWDGSARWQPPDGCAVELVPAGSSAGQRWVRNPDGSWTPPTTPAPVFEPDPLPDL